jgi:hypothetical protein
MLSICTQPCAMLKVIRQSIRQSSDRGVATEEPAQLQQHLLLFKSPEKKPRHRDQGKPSMMHAYVEG